MIFDLRAAASQLFHCALVHTGIDPGLSGWRGYRHVRELIKFLHECSVVTTHSPIYRKITSLITRDIDFHIHVCFWLNL